MTVEQRLKNLILDRYSSVNNFARVIGINESTLRSMLNDHGVKNAQRETIFKITRELAIDAETLYNGEIVFLKDLETDLTRQVSRFLINIRENPCSLNGRYLTSDEKETLIRAILTEIEKLKTNES